MKRILVMLITLAMLLPLVGILPVATAGADVPTLIWIMGDPGKIPPDQAAVEAELNKISEEKVGVKMETLFYNDEKVKLALASGEYFDMTFTCEWYNNYAVQSLAGYFADLTEKLPVETPDLYATMPEIVWQGAKVKGNIYAIPVKKDYAAEIFWRFDKALFVDKLGMEIPDKMSFADIEAFLAAAKAEVPDAYPLTFARDGLGSPDWFFDMINRDALLGIPYSAVGTDAGDTVVLTIEDPDMMARFNLMFNWMNAGYINPDCMTLETGASYSAVKSGQGFYGADAIWTAADKYEQVISKFAGPFLSTASIRGSMNAISANSKNIDLALKFQELVNTDLAYRDMLRYGIPGTHWDVTDEGTAKRTPFGVDSYNPWPFSQGSYSLSTPESPADPNMWKVIFDGYSEAVGTKGTGFSFDISDVDMEIAACKVIVDKYWRGLITGSIDPNTEVPKLIAELEAAGIRDVLADCQKQYDAFVAAM